MGPWASVMYVKCLTSSKPTLLFAAHHYLYYCSTNYQLSDMTVLYLDLFITLPHRTTEATPLLLHS